MTVIGLDVGYSNLKIVAGETGTAPQVMVRPAGAAPLDRLGERIGTGLPQDAVIVDFDGQRWAAAVEPARLEGWQRSLHADYAATPAYRALVTAALVLAGRPVVERLVTGLPVEQARDPRRREALRRALIGRHDTESGGVEVRDVRIVPQPVGAFIDLLWSDLEAETLARLEEGTVLVLDAGYYSFDWAVVVAGELRRGASGTSLEAMSVLLEHAAGLVADQHGGRPQPLALEAALRRGREHLLVLGKPVLLQPVLDLAAPEVGGLALEALRQAMRREVTNVDLVLVTGGGGALFDRQGRRPPLRCLPPATRCGGSAPSTWPWRPSRRAVDVLDKIAWLNLAVELLRRKARISIVHRETGVSRPKLRILHRELHGEGASSGQMPAIGGATIQTRLQQVHAGLFAALYERYAGSALTRRLDVGAVIAAHDLYESMVGQESLLDFNAAWVIARDLLVGTSELRFCGTCELRYLVSNDSRLAPTCPFCSLYPRRRGSAEPRLVFPAWLGTPPSDSEEAA